MNRVENSVDKTITAPSVLGDIQDNSSGELNTGESQFAEELRNSANNNYIYKITTPLTASSPTLSTNTTTSTQATNFPTKVLSDEGMGPAKTTETTLFSGADQTTSNNDETTTESTTMGLPLESITTTPQLAILPEAGAEQAPVPDAVSAT
eukprot:Pgem_evm1s4686